MKSFQNSKLLGAKALHFSTLFVEVGLTQIREIINLFTEVFSFTNLLLKLLVILGCILCWIALFAFGLAVLPFGILLRELRRIADTGWMTLP